jgi:Fe-S-cluster containining protein
VQYLTPYDILRLRKHLGMSSGEFLARYTVQYTGAESGLPVVSLKPADTPDRACCFVTPEGCRVYPSRPTSCRTYPLARAIRRCRDTGRVSEHFALIREPHCKGHDRGRRQNVQEWLRHQDLSDFNPLNDRMLEIIGLKNRHLPGPLDLRRQHLFRLALYDLDAFRDHVFNRGLLDGFQVSRSRLERAQTDDVVLLEIAHQWIKHILFEPEPGSADTSGSQICAP